MLERPSSTPTLQIQREATTGKGPTFPKKSPVVLTDAAVDGTCAGAGAVWLDYDGPGWFPCRAHSTSSRSSVLAMLSVQTLPLSIPARSASGAREQS
jgi:hypothetical protein